MTYFKQPLNFTLSEKLLAPSMLINALSPNGQLFKIIKKQRSQIIRNIKQPVNTPLILLALDSDLFSSKKNLALVIKSIIQLQEFAHTNELSIIFYLPVEKLLLQNYVALQAKTINVQITKVRSILITLIQHGCFISTSLKQPLVNHYFSDLLSWGQLPSSHLESQPHREWVSGLSFAVGIEQRYRDKQVVEQTIAAMKQSHVYIMPNTNGKMSIYKSAGNPWVFKLNLIQMPFKQINSVSSNYIADMIKAPSCPRIPSNGEILGVKKLVSTLKELNQSSKWLQQLKNLYSTQKYRLVHNE